MESGVRELYGLKTRMGMEKVARELLEKKKKRDSLALFVKVVYTGVFIVSALVIVVLYFKKTPVETNKKDYVKSLAPVDEKSTYDVSCYVNEIFRKAREKGISSVNSEWSVNMPPNLREVYVSSLNKFINLRNVYVKDVKADPAAPSVSLVDCHGDNGKRLIVRIRSKENKHSLLSVAALN